MPYLFPFRHLSLLVATLSIAALPSVATSQMRSVAPIPIETILNARQLPAYNPIRISPDGRYVAFTVVDHDASDSVSVTREFTDSVGIPWYGLRGRINVVTVATGRTRVVPVAGSAWNMAWSPDGTTLAFLSDYAPRAGDRRSSRAWVWSAASGKVRLTSSRTVRGSPQWAADGKSVLVQLANRDFASTTAIPSRNAGSAKPITSGSTVTVLTAGVATDTPKTTGAWALFDHPVDLAWVDVEHGTVSTVARHVFPHRVRPSPDGKRIFYTQPLRFENAGTQQILFDIVVLEGATSRTVASSVRLSYNGAQVSWSPDGKRIGFLTGGPLGDGEVYVVPANGSAPPKKVARGAGEKAYDEERVQAPLWNSAGTAMYFADEDGLWRAKVDGDDRELVAAFPDKVIQLVTPDENQLAHWGSDAITIVHTTTRATSWTGFAAVDLPTGAVRPLNDAPRTIGDNGSFNAAAVTPDGTLLAFKAEDATHAPDIFLHRVSEDASWSEQKVSRANPDLDRFTMGEPRIIGWKTATGDSVHGILLYPSGYETGKRYPMVTVVYGGAFPTMRLATSFGLVSVPTNNLQLLATRGYAVLLPDIPLSEGHVTEDLLNVVMPGVDRAIEIGVADPARLGLHGHSFGGYNVIALITQTDRFRAAVMSAGLANLVSAYGQLAPDGTTYGIGVLEHGQFLLNGTPWEQRQRYLDNSPIMRLDRVTTPLMIVHGTDDLAVASYLGSEVFVGLRRLGKEVVLARYVGESHSPGQWRYANQLDLWKRTIDWFDSHLKVGVR